MNPIQHPSANDVLGAPPGIPHDLVRPLPITRFQFERMGRRNASAWLFDWALFTMTRRKFVTLDEAVRKIVNRHGGVRAAEQATGIDKSFISRLMNGHKTAPSAETLRALGLRAVPLYEVLKDHDQMSDRWDLGPAELRDYACRREPIPDALPYMSWLDVVVRARLQREWLDWYMAADVDRRMFLLLVAEDIDTYWDQHSEES